MSIEEWGVGEVLCRGGVCEISLTGGCVVIVTLLSNID